MEMIITGTGRCGTGYMAEVISKAGLECTHEEVFTPEGVVEHPHVWAEASWMAVPYLSHFARTPVVLVHRHPLAVISSFLGKRTFHRRSPYRDFLYRQNPSLRHASPLEAAIDHYLFWNKHALNYADVVTDIDDVAWEKIIPLSSYLTIDGIALGIATTSQTYNHGPRADIDPSMIPNEVWEMRALLKEMEAKT